MTDSANHADRIPEMMRGAYTQFRTGRPTTPPRAGGAAFRQPPRHRLAVIARYRYHLVQDPSLLRPVGLGVTLALPPDVLCYAALIHGYLASQ